MISSFGSFVSYAKPPLWHRLKTRSQYRVLLCSRMRAASFLSREFGDARPLDPIKPVSVLGVFFRPYMAAKTSLDIWETRFTSIGQGFFEPAQNLSDQIACNDARIFSTAVKVIKARIKFAAGSRLTKWWMVSDWLAGLQPMVTQSRPKISIDTMPLRPLSDAEVPQASWSSHSHEYVGEALDHRSWVACKSPQCTRQSEHWSRARFEWLLCEEWEMTLIKWAYTCQILRGCRQCESSDRSLIVLQRRKRLIQGKDSIPRWCRPTKTTSPP